MLKAEIQPYAEKLVQDSYTTKVLLMHCFQQAINRTIYKASVVLTLILRGTPLRTKILGNSLMKDFTPRVWV